MTPERLAEIERTCLQPVAVELLEYIRDLEAQLAAAREAPTKIWNMGHNDDCIFCGLKDSVAAKFVPRPEAWQAENPTATPPSPEVGV